MGRGAAFLLALSPYWVLGSPPHGLRLLLTEESHNLRSASYAAADLGDPGDTPVRITALAGGNPNRQHMDPEVGPGFVRLGNRRVRADRPATVRGRPGVLRILTDEGRAYAHQLAWKENAQVVVAVEADFPISTTRLRAAAASARPVSRATWRRLYTETSLAGQIGHPSRDMHRVPAAQGVENGSAWMLSALIPPGFPLGLDDRRAACQVLRFRGHASYGTNCTDHPSWERVGGTIFAFGQAAATTTSVRIRRYQTPQVVATAETFAVSPAPPVRFYAVPLPEGTCSVQIDGIGSHGEDSRLGPTGPLDAAGPDARRCRPAAG